VRKHTRSALGPVTSEVSFTPRRAARRWARRALVAGVAAVVSVAPVVAVSVTSSASSDETGFLAFGPPAVGSNGAYSVSVAYPTPLTLPPLVGTYSAATYSLIGANTAGCTVSSNGATFSYSHVGNCTISVTATGDPDDQSNGGNSNGHEGPGNDPDSASGTLTVVVTPGVQEISVTPASGPFGTPITLLATGFSGTGAITFAVVSGGTATGCAITAGDKVTSTSAGTCLVTATIAADGTYSSATSAPAAMTFTKATQSIAVVAQAATIGYSITLVATGYTGTGAITFALVSGGTASGCVLKSGNQLSASGVGTCLVTATIASDSTHQGATSPATTMSFVKATLKILTVTASSETVPQGAGFTESAQVSGLNAGDTAQLSGVQFTYTGSGSTSYGPSQVAPSAPGTYSVTPSHATITISPSSDQSSYATVYKYQDGTLTINGKLTVTAAGGTVVAGTIFVPSATVTGVASGDTATVASATYTFAGVAGTSYGPSTTAPRGAGAYSVTPSGASLSVTPSSHQSLYPGPYKYVAGTLIVSPKPVVVPVNAPKPPPPPRTRSFTIKPFREGSYALSKKLKAQVQRLALKVRAGKYKVVDLQAFTDNVFTAAFNVVLNQNRAQAVSTQLAKDLAALKVTGVQINIVTGVSIILVSSNTTVKGRAGNRRVVATLKAA
jgi:outer membrane protein OmpA-like peptidoglycan-associated protein